MDLYPAIDLRDGRCVRLVEGDFGRETVYGDDPVAVARSFAAAGAPWIHVVDLDAARRQGDNRSVISALVGSVSVPIEVGGGVRDASLLEAGVARVVVGSMAMEDPAGLGALVSAYPGRVAVGLDHRDGQVRVRGWEEGAGVSVASALEGLSFVADSLAAVIVTDIGRDGTLAGPDLSGLASALELTGVPVIASGGVSTIEDLRALAALRGASGRGLSGVIVGKALYEGRFDVSEALKAVAA
jgi:phosphoribosylformimino-5-aminoimidazole carboxamide ribotide isomerase